MGGAPAIYFLRWGRGVYGMDTAMKWLCFTDGNQANVPQSICVLIFHANSVKRKERIYIFCKIWTRLINSSFHEDKCYLFCTISIPQYFYTNYSTCSPPIKTLLTVPKVKTRCRPWVKIHIAVGQGPARARMDPINGHAYCPAREPECPTAAGREKVVIPIATVAAAAAEFQPDSLQLHSRQSPKWNENSRHLSQTSLCVTNE